MSPLRDLLPAALALTALLVSWLSFGATAAETDVTERARKFVAAHEAKLRPLEIKAGLAWWNANTSGKDEDFAKKEEAQNEIDAALADPKPFKELKELRRQRKQIDDPVIARCIDVLYLTYLEKQVDPELLKKITAKANAVEKAFNVYRAKVDGKECPTARCARSSRNPSNSERRQAVWEASKKVGAVVEADLKELVKLRNEAAVKLGFKNFHQTAARPERAEDGDDLMKLFDELDELTREPFAKAKTEIDVKLAANCGVRVDELRPWHYHDPFFQESPAVFAVSLDAPFKPRPTSCKLCREFYAGIGLPIDDVIARSDLYEKKGKSPHAFCTDIDREGDVRVLANIVPNEYWMGTMLHELGHSVYSSKNIPQKLPYVLRMRVAHPDHRGRGHEFERFSKSRPWLEKMGVKVADAAGVRRNRARRCSAISC